MIAPQDSLEDRIRKSLAAEAGGVSADSPWVTRSQSRRPPRGLVYAGFILAVMLVGTAGLISRVRGNPPDGPPKSTLSNVPGGQTTVPTSVAAASTTLGSPVGNLSPAIGPSVLPPRVAAIPGMRVQGDKASLDLDFLDGTSVALQWPAGFDFFSDGLELSSWARIPSITAREIIAYRIDPATSVSELFGMATLIGSYPNGEGGSVELWRPERSEIDYLVYTFGPWIVLVYDYGPDAIEEPMSEESRELWATHLQAEVETDGSLVLRADAPLQLASPAAYPSPMSAAFHSRHGVVDLIPGPCTPGFISSIDGDDWATWCDVSAGLVIRVQGSPEFQEEVSDRLTVVSVSPAEH